MNDFIRTRATASSLQEQGIHRRPAGDETDCTTAEKLVIPTFY